jgi:hypothetical protein
MRTLLALLIVGTVASAAAQVQPVAVPAGVKGLLTPGLETWRKLQTDPKCLALGDPQKDHPRHCSQLKDRLDSQLLVLSHIKGVTADEALAALFSFGLQGNQGDQGHDFVCMAAARGNGMTKALRKYRTCDLDISADYPQSMRSDINICQRAIDRAVNVIRTNSADKICTWD